MKKVLESIRTIVRQGMSYVAIAINHLSGGRVHADHITIVGLLAHIPIAFAIAYGHNWWAAGLLVIFGLFDVLDGELARLQERASARGMLLDATTDRMKETLLYTGAAYALATTSQPTLAAWAVAACGASLCVSYVKAKGEAAVASSGRALTPATLNRLFSDGLLTFEVRMALLLLGLLTGRLALALIIITVLATYTALQRLLHISQKL